MGLEKRKELRTLKLTKKSERTGSPIWILANFRSKCIVDDPLMDILQGKCLRQRGPQPTLKDSEVLTMEIVGEFLGINQDKILFWFCREHDGDWFPDLSKIHRTTFVPQAANVWKIKELIWHNLL